MTSSSEEEINRYLEQIKSVSSELGDDSPETVGLILQIAVSLDYAGDYLRSVQLLDGILTNRCARYLETTDKALDALHQMGIRHFKSGDFEAAELIQERLLSYYLLEDVAGSDGAIVALHNLGVTLVAQRKYDRLTELGNEIIDARLMTLSDDNIRIVDNLYWLARWWRYFGEFQRASKMYRRVIRGCIRNRHGGFTLVKCIVASSTLIPLGLRISRP